MKYYVQEKGSLHNAIVFRCDGPLHAEKMYRESAEFSGNAKYLIMVWHIEDLSEDEFYKHLYFFDEKGIIEVRKYSRAIV